MKKIICDRCGGGISGRRVHISVYGDKNVVRKYVANLRMSDFCTECIEDIVDFALNKDICDECVRAMEAESAMLRAADEETEVSPNMEKYRDVMATYLGEPVREDGRVSDEGEESSRQKEPDSGTTICRGIDMNQIEESKTNIQYMVPIEDVAAYMRTIHQDRQYQSGQHQEACSADTHDTPQ